MRRLKPPFYYYGGKTKYAKTLLEYMADHKTYVEVFGGSAALLLAKPPSKIDVYNDINDGVVNFFNVLRDPHKLPTLQRLVDLTPYSRAEYYRCLTTWNKEGISDVEKAYRWFVVAAASFGGRFGAGWSHAVTTSSAGLARHVRGWLVNSDRLANVAERFKAVQIEHKDFRELIPAYAREGTLFYCDPPYVHATRNADAQYVNEMDKRDHEELLELMLKSTGKFMVSGYDHPLYDCLVAAGWRRIAYKAVMTASKNPTGSRSREEVLWLSY